MTDDEDKYITAMLALKNCVNMFSASMEGFMDAQGDRTEASIPFHFFMGRKRFYT